MPTYPAPPGPKLMWEDFASLLQTGADAPFDSIFGEASYAQKAEANSYTPAYTSIQQPGANEGKMILLLSEPYDLDGWLVATNQITSFGGVEYSTDTTNGLDGTWTKFAQDGLNNQSPTVANFRNEIRTQSVAGVVGIRFYADNHRLGCLHLYGRKSTLSGLFLWDPTLDQPFTHSGFDTEDTVDAEVNDITLRVKNLSGAEATNVTLTMGSRIPIAGFAGMHTVDLAGGGFGAFPLNIGNLADNAISGVITIRQTIVDTALGLGWARLIVDAD